MSLTIQEEKKMNYDRMQVLVYPHCICGRYRLCVAWDEYDISLMIFHSAVGQIYFVGMKNPFKSW